jgi:hypothetical protein
VAQNPPPPPQLRDNRHKFNGRVNRDDRDTGIWDPGKFVASRFLDGILTAGETWVRHCELQSVEWLHKHSPKKKKVRVQSFVGKITCSVLWDKKVCALIDISGRGHTISSARRIVTLKELKTRIARVTPKKNEKCSFNTIIPSTMPAFWRRRPLCYPGELFCRSRVQARLCANRLSPLWPLKDDLRGKILRQ